MAQIKCLIENVLADGGVSFKLDEKTHLFLSHNLSLIDSEFGIIELSLRNVKNPGDFTQLKFGLDVYEMLLKEFEVDMTDFLKIPDGKVSVLTKDSHSELRVAYVHTKSGGCSIDIRNYIKSDKTGSFIPTSRGIRLYDYESIQSFCNLREQVKGQLNLLRDYCSFIRDLSSELYALWCGRSFVEPSVLCEKEGATKHSFIDFIFSKRTEGYFSPELLTRMSEGLDHIFQTDLSAMLTARFVNILSTQMLFHHNEKQLFKGAASFLND